MPRWQQHARPVALPMEPVTDAEQVPEAGGEDTTPADPVPGVDGGDAAPPLDAAHGVDDTEVSPGGEEDAQMAGDPDGAAETGGPVEDSAAEPVAAATPTRCVPSRAANTSPVARRRRLCALPQLACAWRGGAQPR